MLHSQNQILCLLLLYSIYEEFVSLCLAGVLNGKNLQFTEPISLLSHLVDY